MREETITALEMRKKFGGVLDRVATKGHHVTVLRDNKPLVTLIPAQEHEKNCTDQDRPQRIEKLLQNIKEFNAKYPFKSSKNQKDAAEVIREMRDERTEHLINLHKW